MIMPVRQRLHRARVLYGLLQLDPSLLSHCLIATSPLTPWLHHQGCSFTSLMVICSDTHKPRACLVTRWVLPSNP